MKSIEKHCYFCKHAVWKGDYPDTKKAPCNKCKDFNKFSPKKRS